MSEQMDGRPLAGLELRYHGAMPNWCKVVGLDIRAVPEWEGGGFMIRRDQAEAIVAAGLRRTPQEQGPKTAPENPKDATRD